MKSLPFPWLTTKSRHGFAKISSAMALRFARLLSRPNSMPKQSASFMSFDSFSYSSSTEPSSLRKGNPEPELKLSNEEITQINLLLPRLCLSDHLKTAIQLTVASLLANPPQSSISLIILVHSLTSQPDLTLPMSLLTRLRHTPLSHHHLTPITAMLITSYLRRGRPKDALKIYNWVRRPGSVCDLEPRVYGILINAFCRNGFVVESLRVMRDMVGKGLVPGERLRRRVFGSLLKEARISEAVDLERALVCIVSGSASGNESVKNAVALLDQTIANWTE